MTLFLGTRFQFGTVHVCACSPRQDVRDATQATQERQRGRQEKAIGAGGPEKASSELSLQEYGERWRHQERIPSAAVRWARWTECKPLSHPHWPKRRTLTRLWKARLERKVTLGRTLKLCSGVKRKGLGVGKREVARRQSKEQGFWLGAKDWGWGKGNVYLLKGCMENTSL